jgi:ribosomal protein S18 acetylase RimI-like enzyme
MQLNNLEIVELNPDKINMDYRFSFWDFIEQNNVTRKFELIKEINEGHRKMFFGKIGDEIVGGFSIKKKDENQLHMGFLVVKSNFRNQGIGSQFIDFFIDYAKKHCFIKVSIGVLANNEGAKRLYEKKGFTQVEVNEDKIILLMILNPAV